MVAGNMQIVSQQKVLSKNNALKIEEDSSLIANTIR